MKTFRVLFASNVLQTFHEEGKNVELQHHKPYQPPEKQASAAKDAANPKPAAKKDPGLVPIAAAFKKCKKFARDDPRAKAICDFIMDSS